MATKKATAKIKKPAKAAAGSVKKPASVATNARTQKPAKVVAASAKRASKAAAPKKAAAPSKTAAKAAAPKKAVAKSAAPTKAARANAVEVGATAPAFDLKDQHGNTVSSAALKGAPYVLYFYPKDDTPGCTTEACGFRDAESLFGRAKVRVLGVSPDSTTRHENFSNKYGLKFSLLADTEKTLAQAYGVWALKQNYGREYMGIVRSTFLVDAKGVVRKAWRSVKVPGHVDAVLAEAQTL